MSAKRTALYEEHAQLGASFTDFGGWDMPLKYANDVAEHRAVREAAGLFDLSHMGEFRIKGPDAGAYLDYCLLSHMSLLKVGKAKYSILLDESGAVLDDLISYRLGQEEFLVVPNAANVASDFAAFAERSAGFDVELTNESEETSLIAVQGPRAEEILLAMEPSQPQLVRDLSYYAASPLELAGRQVLLARTGYTGEDGFEIYLPHAAACGLWQAALAAGQPLGLVPAGLAARDSLRLEAGMPLYGHELSPDITAFESGLGRLVEIALSKKEADFVGRQALQEQAKQPPARKLVGLKGQGKRPARAGSLLFDGDKEVGLVTSGIPSPSLGYPLALALIASDYGQAASIEVDIRGKRALFDLVEPPFYSRKK